MLRGLRGAEAEGDGEAIFAGLQRRFPRTGALEVARSDAACPRRPLGTGGAQCLEHFCSGRVAGELHRPVLPQHATLRPQWQVGV